MNHTAWHHIGRWAAWLNAAFLIVGAALFGPWLGALERSRPGLALAYTPLREAGAWARSGAFLLLGLGYLIAAQLTLAAWQMPRIWALLSAVLGVLAALSLVSAVAGIPALNYLSLMGVIFGSAIWSAWIGRLLRESEVQRQEVAYADA